jgi:isocitrate dehydrogenase kinase/phosphatase
LWLFFWCSYRANIENVVDAEYVERLKDLPMRDFENEIWEAVGKKRGLDRSYRQLVKHFLMITYLFIIVLLCIMMIMMVKSYAGLIFWLINTSSSK